MGKLKRLILMGFVFAAVGLAFPKLPKPLQLPPGLVETLPISPAGSYFGEAVKIQDCPEDKDNPLGLCDNLLFGGFMAVDRVWVNDPFDFTVGAFNVKTGQSVGDLIYGGLPFQTLFTVILQLNAGRIPTDTFRFQGPAAFERGPNDSLVFRYNSEVFLDFSTFVWPTPDYNPARGFRAGAGSTLDPFLKFQATSGGTKATAVRTGDIDQISSIGDPVKLHYSIPCDVADKNFSFEYTNSSTGSRGGVFHMDVLAAVSCTNARGSSAASGDADIVSFTGFGSWSKDTNRHVATVQINTAANTPYFMVQVDGTLSGADTILKAETQP